MSAGSNPPAILTDFLHFFSQTSNVETGLNNVKELPKRRVEGKTFTHKSYFAQAQPGPDCALFFMFAGKLLISNAEQIQPS